MQLHLLRSLFLLFCTVVQAAILQVPVEYATLQEAVDQAQTADTVQLARGTYFENITISTDSLLLASNWLFSGDTLDIQETAIDGNWEGTAINVESQRTVSIVGLTVQRGLAWRDGSSDNYGGGVNLCDSAGVYLDHSVFRENRSTCGEGAIIGCYWGDSPSFVRITNSVLYAYLEPGDCDYQTIQVFFRFAQTFTLENVQYFGNALGLRERAFNADADVTTLRNVEFRNLYGESPLIIGSPSFTVMSDVLLDSCISVDRHLFMGFASEGTMRVRNLTARNCSNLAPCDDEPQNDGGILRFTADSLFIDSLYVLDNTSLTRNPGGIYAADVYGVMTNSLVQGNCSGSFQTGEESRGGWITDITNMQVENTHFRGNTSIASTASEDLYLGPFRYASGALLTYANDVPGDFHIRNCDFTDNELIDPDDYTQTGVGRTESQGTALHVSGGVAGWRVNIAIEDCRFLNNRLENVVPEIPQDWITYVSSVGSTICFVSGHPYHHFLRYTMRNCEIRGNDNGGILARGGGGTLYLQNVELVDNNRRGVHCYIDSVFMENVLIQGTQVTALEWPQACYFQELNPSEQRALTLFPQEYAELNNVSVIDNNLPFLFNAPYASNAPPLFNNCMFSGNTYDCITAPPEPSQSIDQLQFFHCVLPEAMNGSDNLVGVTPTWDAELGAPYLSANSIGVDAGNSDTAYNDLENPESPGTALWPSHGSLRNDIGYTGGPHVVDLDYLPVAPATPITFPTSPALGDAYPNPFNPVTTIPFVIHRPSHLHLAVYNLRGQHIATLADADFPPGEHRVTFDGSSHASGVYFIRLHGEDVSQSRKVLLLK